MYKVLNATDLRLADVESIEKQNISSFQLMERAAFAVLDRLLAKNSCFSDKEDYVLFCGMGNNGGDGLALGRMLASSGKNIQIYVVKHREVGSIDFERNLRLARKCNLNIIELNEKIPDFRIHESSIVLDCMLGSGLSRPVEGFLKSIVQKINDLPNGVVSIDSPSGFFMDDNSNNDKESIVQADYTYTIALPKLSFFFPDSYRYVGNWEVVPIGLDEDYIKSRESVAFFIQPSDIRKMLKKREAYAHKGNFGHALLIAGSYGKMGAAVLAASACLQTGAGLVSLLCPRCGYEIVQISLPEAMVMTSSGEKELRDYDHQLDYSSIGIGPGIGSSEETASFLLNCLKSYKKPMVLDADALNILAKNRDWLEYVPADSIMSPHPGEFKRLVGSWQSDFERLELLKKFSVENKVFVILKGKFSTLSCPSGEVYFNCTGNPGMSTAGSGDVLTGMLSAFLAQGYEPKNAALLGMYLHGLAGDLAAERKTQYSMIASDIIDGIADAYRATMQLDVD